MCVGFEGELVEVTGSGLTRSGILQVDDRRFPIGLTFVPEARLGDRVVAHTGQAVRVVASHLPIQGH
jgi:hydrogenase maturation factor